MNKCALCTRPATVKTEKYDTVGTAYETAIYYCDGHYKNMVADGTDPYKVTREIIFREAYLLKANSDGRAK